LIGRMSLALRNNPARSPLAAPSLLAALPILASFATLTLDKTGTDYWLTATATGLSTATSSVFSITPGAATQLAFSQQPGTTVANRRITTAVKVRAHDAPGNVASSFAGNVSVA